VTVVAREAEALAAVRTRLGVATVCADVTEEHTARRIVTKVRPQILVLNADATPRMGRLDALSWADFSVAWETDVKAGLHWLQAALTLPLAPASRVLGVSSGAAVNGLPLSGGYAGAKRMLWIMFRVTPRASPSASRATRASRPSRVQRLEHNAALAEP
jgi:NADP-dependent 3-hydroxy acid dehydrogenase YdfG